jgi:hypothetical protein
MATDKKHIAVYLAPEVEQALMAFCREKGLISKKGTMFSAGVNAALTQFFGIADTRASNTPSETGNTPQDMGNTPSETGNTPQDMGNIPITTSNILTNTGNISTHLNNIPVENLVMEGLPGKLQA